MTREFKFRAWDKEKKLLGYFSLQDIDYDEDCGTYFNASNLKGYFQFEYNYYDNQSHNDKQILMQFTGLQDKNGKNIYEGDIVKRIDNGKIVDVLYWFGGFLPFAPICKVQGVNPKDVVIIGNIYENPELLGVNDE